MADFTERDEIIDIEDLYNKHTSAENIKESFSKMTAPTGRYLFAATKVEARRGRADHPFENMRGRDYVHVFGKLTSVSPEGVTKKMGNIGFDASWQRRTDKFGNADKAYKLWGQLVRAYGMEKDSIGEVRNAIPQFPFSTYVVEKFKTPEGNRVARDKDTRADYRKQGFAARNDVDSISRA